MKRGASAPEFELVDQYRGRLRLSTMLRSGPVVLSVYPDVTSTNSVKEARYFRKLGKEFRGLGVHLVGVSPETLEENRRFSGEYALDFPLLFDPGAAVIRAYGAWRPWSLYPLQRARRHTFVIGPRSRVLEVIKNEWTMSVHADLALEALRTSGAR